MAYFVVYQSPNGHSSYPYDNYEQARLALADTIKTFAREGATVLSHNDNCATLRARTSRGMTVNFTLTIYNNYWGTTL